MGKGRRKGKRGKRWRAGGRKGGELARTRWGGQPGGGRGAPSGGWSLGVEGITERRRRRGPPRWRPQRGRAPITGPSRNGAGRGGLGPPGTPEAGRGKRHHGDARTGGPTRGGWGCDRGITEGRRSRKPVRHPTHDGNRGCHPPGSGGLGRNLARREPETWWRRGGEGGRRTRPSANHRRRHSRGSDGGDCGLGRGVVRKETWEEANKRADEEAYAPPSHGALCLRGGRWRGVGAAGGSHAGGGGLDHQPPEADHLGQRV